MKITTLQKALDYYLQSAECHEEKEVYNTLSAIKELAATKDRLQDDDLWKGSVQVISSSQLTDFLNLTTYDIYGKLARTHNGKPPFEYYAHNCRQNLIEDLTNDQLMFGYDFLSDLWQANEETGDNNEDGTFKH